LWLSIEPYITCVYCIGYHTLWCASSLTWIIMKSETKARDTVNCVPMREKREREREREREILFASRSVFGLINYFLLTLNTYPLCRQTFVDSVCDSFLKIENTFQRHILNILQFFAHFRFLLTVNIISMHKFIYKIIRFFSDSVP